MNNQKAKPAIVCSDITTPSEEFIRRHVRYLNAGDNCLLYERQSTRSNTSPSTKPEFQLSRTIAQRIFFKSVPRLIGDAATKRIARMLFLKDILSFLREQNVSCLLFEFGTLAVRHYDLALYSGIPFAIYFRGYDASQELLNLSYVERLRQVVNKASYVCAVSPHLIHNLNRMNITCEKTLIIPSGVEIPPSRPQPRLKMRSLLSVGRFIEKKAHVNTILSYRRLLERIGEAAAPTLTIVGDGPLFESCYTLVKRERLEGKVILTGALENKQVLELMEESLIYIQSSITALTGDAEGFPSAIQEAMARSCVIVSTNHGGVLFYLRHLENALISPENDIENMARNLHLALISPELSNALALSGQALAVKKFDIVKAVDQISFAFLDSLQKPH